MIPSDRLQKLIESKDTREALKWCKKYHYSEGWAIIDGALIIYDLDRPPVWLAPVLEMLDEDGNTPPELTGMYPQRAPRPGEYADPQPANVLWHDDVTLMPKWAA